MGHTMNRFKLVRDESTDQGTPGTLYLGEQKVCHTMELPWRDVDGDGESDKRTSCIPKGAYKVTWMAKSGSGKYRDVYHVHDVPGRSEILIHTANYAGDVLKGWRSDLLGCIAPCRAIGWLTPEGGKRQMAGTGSLLGMKDLHAATKRQAFELEIV